MTDVIDAAEIILIEFIKDPSGAEKKASDFLTKELGYTADDLSKIKGLQKDDKSV